MIVRNVLFLLLATLLLAACQKNDLSKIPRIGLTYFGPEIMRVNTDTVRMQFSVEDGDADLGVSKNSSYFDIYIKDFRFDTGYVGYYFPEFDENLKDATKGLKGKCVFEFTTSILYPRSDSAHMLSDTTHFEVYIRDKAGNESNHFVTGNVIMTI